MWRVAVLFGVISDKVFLLDCGGCIAVWCAACFRGAIFVSFGVYFIIK